MTQQRLADRIGIKFQQVQKYETGMNRVSASRLWDIAQALSVPPGYFFDAIEGAGAASRTAGADGPEGSGALPHDVMGNREALDLVRSYYAIPEHQRRRLFDLARVLSEAA